jgi:predicted esterase
MAASMNTHPHANQPVLSVGPDPAAARIGAILIHGRGASARDILGVAHELSLADVAFVAPQAAGNTWYPYSFLAPIAQNEPGLTSALAVIEGLVRRFEQAGVASDRVALLGFSQGACLTLEFAARHPRRYHAIVAFSGGVIGPPGTPRDYPGSFEGTPAFLGCSDVDAHIPVERVHESADLYRRMGALVDARIYPGMGHTINEDEIAAARALLSR